MKKSHSRFATRYLLPVEMYMAFALVSWGLSGALGSGSLWGILFSINANSVWAAVLCTIGGASLLTSGAEWFLGRAWSDANLYQALRCRCACAFFTGIVWIYVGYMAVTVSGARVIVSLALQAPVGFVFACFCFYGNMRILCVLDPKVSTVRLEHQLISERQRAMPR